jgi:hypothetical protein
MKTEHDFNAWLKKELKRFDSYKAVKISDRFKIGLPDWLIFHHGRAVVVECKFIQDITKSKYLLGHPVTRPQITSLKSFEAVDVLPFILIGIRGEKIMYLGGYQELTSSGNVTLGVLDSAFKMYGHSQIDMLLNYMFL